MKMKNYILILIVILSFVLPAETKQSEIPEIKYESLDINGNKNYMVSKPVFIDNVKFKDINDKINKLIDKKTLEKEEKEYCVEDPGRCGSFQLIMGPAIDYQDKDVISLSINIYQYTGGAHGGSYTESFIIDRKTGKDITKSILGEAKDKVLGKIYNYVMKNPQEIFFSSDMIDKNCVIKDCPIFLKEEKDSVQIRYGQYAVAPYAASVQVFEYNFKTKKLYFYDATTSNEEKIEIK